MKQEKRYNIKVKVINDAERVLRFIGSDETQDRDRDIVMADGWDLTNYKKNPVFLWAHDYKVPPVGKAIKVGVDKATKKLMFDIKFATVAELSSFSMAPSEHALFADTIYNMYKNGYLNTTSVGFIPKEMEVRNDAEAQGQPEWMRGHKILKQELLELSAVPVPSNPNALVEARAFKGIKPEGVDLVEKLIQEGERQKMIEQIEALKKEFEDYKKISQENFDALLSVEKAGATLSKTNIAKLKGVKGALEAAAKVLTDMLGMPEDEEPTEEGCNPDEEKAVDVPEEKAIEEKTENIEIVKTDEIDLDNILVSD